MNEEEIMLDQEPASEEDDNGRVRANVWIRRSLYNQVIEIGEAEDETFAAIVRQALKDYVKKYKEGA